MASIHETLAAGGGNYARVVAEDPPRRSFWRRFGVPLAFIVVFGLFALIVIGAWQDYLAPAGEPPIVRAPPGPIKRPPDTPGAVDMYGEGAATLAAGQPPTPRVERILPREPPPPKTVAEADPSLLAAPATNPTPTPPSAVPAASAETAGAGALRAMPTASAVDGPGEAFVPPASAPPTASSAAATDPAPGAPQAAGAAPVRPQPSETPLASVQPARPATPASPAPTTAPRANGLAGSGPWGVQIAAVSSREAAERGWRMLVARHPDLLGGLQLRIEELRLANGSTLYRLQGIGLADRDAAARVCARLRALGEQCFVVGAR